MSYLIVDQAEKDMEVSKDGIPNDPFLDAEIDIPSPLSPIVKTTPSFKSSRNDLREETLEETSIPQDTSNVVLRGMKPLNTPEVIKKDLEDRKSRDERIGLSCIPETEIVWNLQFFIIEFVVEWACSFPIKQETSMGFWKLARIIIRTMHHIIFSKLPLLLTRECAEITVFITDCIDIAWEREPMHNILMRHLHWHFTYISLWTSVVAPM